MRRVARAATQIAVVGIAAGALLWPVRVLFAVPGFVIGAAAVVVAMFAGFRAAHLHDVAQLRR
jgi:hypothetical protein